MIPLYAFVAYIFGSFLLAVVGPFEYLVLDPVKVFLYLTYVMACFIAGYRFSFRNGFPCGGLIRPGGKVWVLIGIVLGVATTSYILFHNGPSNSLVAALSDPGTAYRESHDAMRYAQKVGVDVSLVGQIQTLTSGLTIYAIAAACVGKKKYPGWILYLAFCYPLLQLAIAVRTGTFKFVGDWFVFALTIYLLAQAKTISRRNKVLMMLAVMAFLGAQMYTQESRKMAMGAALGFPQLPETNFRNDNFVAEALGPIAYDQLASPIFYLTNGYAGLSAALDQDFVWTYGLGNSIALQGYAREFLDVDVLPQTYIVRAGDKTGWTALRFWSTIFPWLASDITFAGCGIVFAFLGFIYPRVFCRAYCSRCPLSAALLFYLNVLLIYVPCNNQLMQERTQMIAFVGTALAYWIATKSVPDKTYSENRDRFQSISWNIAKTKIRHG
jgi:hypothetical protein